MRKITFLGVSGKVEFSNQTTDRIDDVYYMLLKIFNLQI